MSGTTWTAGGIIGDWFNAGFGGGFNGFGDGFGGGCGGWGCGGDGGGDDSGNWGNGVPVLSATGTQSVFISGSIATQPIISDAEPGAPLVFFVDQQGFNWWNALSEIQIDGQFITLSSGANLTIQGIAIGNFRGTSGIQNAFSTITDLTAANGTLAAFDTHMLITATGTDTLSVNDDNHNFGLISAVGAGNALDITIFPGGHPQSTNTLYNYGLIEAADGGIVEAGVEAAGGGTASALANPGWIEALGGTFITIAFIEDDANAPNGAATPDGYIEIGGGGTAILLGGVAQNEEVLFLGGSHQTLEIANNNEFAGNIAGFGAGDTIGIAMETAPVTLGYAGSLLTVGEYNGAGLVTAVVTIDVGAGYSPADFAALNGARGLDIVTSADLAGQNFTFAGADGNTNFSDTLNYAGGVAPGLNIAAGEIVTIEAKASLDTGALTDNGTVIVTGSTFVAPLGIGGGGGVLLENGGTLDLTSTQPIMRGNPANATTANITFGTGGSLADPNVLIQDSTTFGFTGTVFGFGLNDIITAGPAILGFTPGDKIVVSTGGNQLYINDTTDGKFFGINFNTAVSAAGFVETFGTNGLNIETTATAAESRYTFNSTGTASFYTPGNYTGGVAPGYSIVSGEIVTILSSPAFMTAAAPVNNTGTFVIEGPDATLLDMAALTGDGTVDLAGGTLALVNAAGTSTNLVDFGAASAGSPDVLYLDGTGTASFGGVLAGFSANDTIILGGSFLPTQGSAADVHLSFNSGTGLLTIADTVGGTVYTDTLTFSGPVPGQLTASIGPTGIFISDIPCFAAGTRILTPDGDIAVERLKLGDEVLTLRGAGDAVGRVIWAGRRNIDLARHPRPEKVMPVRIGAGALGAGLPEHDLLLSPDHCLFMDGHLIEAKMLVNGATVIQDESVRHVMYHHIELERHDVVLAEGVPVETYLESGNRTMFDGGAVPVLHPDFAPASRRGACAPLAAPGPLVQAVRQRLLDRALMLGFSVTTQVDLVVKAGIERLAPERDSPPGRMLFALALPHREVQLLSSAGVPAHTGADPDDRRRLGVAVTGLRLLTAAGHVDIALDDPAHCGFHDNEGTHRWTNGAARLALPAYDGQAILEVQLRGQAGRWTAAQKSAAIRA